MHAFESVLDGKRMENLNKTKYQKKQTRSLSARKLSFICNPDIREIFSGPKLETCVNVYKLDPDIRESRI